MSIIVTVAPITVKNDKDHNASRIVKTHSDWRWNNYIDQFEHTVDQFESDFGLRADNVRRHKEDFLKVTLTVTDEALFESYDGNTYNIVEKFMRFLRDKSANTALPRFGPEGDGTFVDHLVIKVVQLVRKRKQRKTGGRK